MGQVEQATVGGGCFWCLEAVFQRLEGVQGVVSGYAGGHTDNPSYRGVCGGQTGHAEVVQVTYDAEKIGFAGLLEWFWRAHDPTTLNRQGADVGTQYRSIVLTHNQDQQRIAEAMKLALDEAGQFSKPIVTQIEPLKTFYKAEIDHQDYYNNHKAAPYCAVVIQPKLEKLNLSL